MRNGLTFFYSRENLCTFTSCQVLKSNYNRRCQQRFYYAKPKSLLAINHHNLINENSQSNDNNYNCDFEINTSQVTSALSSHTNHSTQTPSVSSETANNVIITSQVKLNEYPVDIRKVDLFLVNIQGLITKRNNKCKFVREFTNTSNNQIIAITETWANFNFDAEYIKEFKEYNIERSDRKFGYDPDDDEQLSSRGGVLLLTSPNITITLITKFSNGNCEVLIASLSTVNIIVILFYTPSGKNFSLRKYTEDMSKINNYLAYYKPNELGKSIILLGDFNFPPGITTWIKTVNGLIANFSEGISPKKKEH